MSNTIINRVEKGQAKIEVAASWDEIENLLNANYSLSKIFEILSIAGKITCSLRQFQRNVKNTLNKRNTAPRFPGGVAAPTSSTHHVGGVGASKTANVIKNQPSPKSTINQLDVSPIDLKDVW